MVGNFRLVPCELKMKGESTGETEGNQTLALVGRIKGIWNAYDSPGREPQKKRGDLTRDKMGKEISVGGKKTSLLISFQQS